LLLPTPLDHYEKIIEMHRAAYSGRMLVRRLSGTRTRILKGMHALRTLSMEAELAELRRIRDRLGSE